MCVLSHAALNYVNMAVEEIEEKINANKTLLPVLKKIVFFIVMIYIFI